MKSLVIQFAKWPEVGKVKTRLAADIGNEQAKHVHIQLMSHVLSNITGEGWDLMLSFSHIKPEWPQELASFKRLLEAKKASVSVQTEGDLGVKLLAAFETYLQDYDKVVIVGSDCPTLTPGYIENALAALDYDDLVIGPAEDGGYVLIGAKATRAELFQGVAWGTSQVRAQTLLNADRLGLSCGQLSSAWDVDTLTDYRRFQSTYGSL